MLRSGQTEDAELLRQAENRAAIVVENKCDLEWDSADFSGHRAEVEHMRSYFCHYRGGHCRIARRDPAAHQWRRGSAG